MNTPLVLEKMIMELPGEDDFLDAMKGPCREWHERSVKNAALTSFDGTMINYY